MSNYIYNAKKCIFNAKKKKYLGFASNKIVTPEGPHARTDSCQKDRELSQQGVLFQTVKKTPKKQLIKYFGLIKHKQLDWTEYTKLSTRKDIYFRLLKFRRSYFTHEINICVMNAAPAYVFIFACPRSCVFMCVCVCVSSSCPVNQTSDDIPATWRNINN